MECLHFQKTDNKILIRYLETAALVYSWYLDDCWEEESVATKMIRRVNNMHRSPHDLVLTSVTSRCSCAGTWRPR